MPDLSTTYLGLNLASPLVVAACPLSSHVDRIKQVEAAGAGAIVIRSLFEEQLQAEAVEFDEAQAEPIDYSAEMTSYEPVLEHGGAREHLHWIEVTRKAVSFPLIGSLNAVSRSAWKAYAKQLAAAGCDALELNLYSVPLDLDRSSAEIEDGMLAIVGDVVGAVDVPVSVKLAPYVTGLGSFVRRLTEAGARGAVLFNRFIQPDIDPDKGCLVNEMPPSHDTELRLPLRWTAILAGRAGLDLCTNTGVITGRDLAKTILAGAAAAQSASAILEQGIDHIGTMLDELSAWLDDQGAADLDAVRGRLSSQEMANPFAYERAQYVKLLAQ